MSFIEPQCVTSIDEFDGLPYKTKSRVNTVQM